VQPSGTPESPVKQDQGGAPARVARFTPHVGSARQLAIVALLSTFLMPLFATASTLKVGDRAPDFALLDQGGTIVKLSDFHGKRAVVLAFYIRASTPG
jgi:hypothetical protein